MNTKMLDIIKAIWYSCNRMKIETTKEYLARGGTITMLPVSGSDEETIAESRMEWADPKYDKQQADKLREELAREIRNRWI